MAESGSAQSEDPRVAEVRAAFGPGGVLERGLRGFRAREPQVGMAEAVARTLAAKGTLIAEAGTGTGKTFAYLVPALLAGSKVVVSTAGKPLQEQLFTKDLPLVLGALGIKANVVLLKGRSNYICAKKLEEVDIVDRLEEKIAAIQRFARTTKDGDIAGLSSIAESDPLWSLVTSTDETCLGANCPAHGECFLMKARENAKKSDILVVNHHLFLSAAMMRSSDPFIPGTDLTVIDEAHKLPQVARDLFGETLSTQSVAALARDIRKEGEKSAADGARWKEIGLGIETAAKRLSDMAESALGLAAGGKADVEALEGFDEFAEPLGDLVDELKTAVDALNANEGRSPELGLVARRTAQAHALADRWLGVAAGGSMEDPDGEAVLEEDGSPHVRWVERRRRGFSFHSSPISVATDLAAIREEREGAWVLTSATLSVGKTRSFRHFKDEVGLADAETLSFPSPFDYRRAALYIPEGLPDPRDPGFPEAVARESFPFIRKAFGRTLFLCTSLRAVDGIARTLEGLAARECLGVRILKQGAASRLALIAEFRASPRSVLVGSLSFWEGIDVKGDALSVVVIDKLPFSPPDDPVTAARCRWMKMQGKSPFNELQVPAAVTLLRQGAGRLIRSETDSGALILCDRRVVSRRNSYGKRVLDSLPPFRRTEKLDEALTFVPGAADGAGAAQAALSRDGGQRSGEGAAEGDAKRRLGENEAATGEKPIIANTLQDIFAMLRGGRRSRK